MDRHYRRIERMSALLYPIEAAVLEMPSGRLARLCAGLAHQLTQLTRRLPHRLYHQTHFSPLGIAQAILTYRYLPIATAFLAILLTTPVLWRGWGFTDDLLQRSMLLSASLPEAATRLFVFLEPATNARMMDLGILPWWTLETVRTSFFRPIAAFSLWLDYQLWPNSSALMHAHSILWYGALCALTAFVYRRFMGRTLAAGIAALFFAMDIAHIGCIVSLAARNALMTLFFGLLTLLAYDRRRREEWRPGAFLGPCFLVLSLLSAEAGIATAAYLAAYALFLDRGTIRQRLLPLAPYAAIIVAWRLLYQILGYGAWGSGFYIDPGREPLRFAASVLEHGPVLLLGQWSVPEPGIYSLFSTWVSRAAWLTAVLILAALGALLIPLLRKDRVARFWGLGMTLSVIPACSITLPSGRMLIFVGVGAMGLMAQFIAGLLERVGWTSTRRIWKAPASALCALLIGFHGLLSPILLSSTQSLLNTFFYSIINLGPLPEAASQDVVIVNAPCPGHFIYAQSLRESRHEPMPAHLRVLAPGYSAVTITRADERTLIVRPEDGYLVHVGPWMKADPDPFPLVHPVYGYQHGDGFFRSEDHPMMLGERVELTGMSVEITALTENGQPAEARITFDRPLEDPSLVWLQWDWEQNVYAPFTIPAIGKTAYIPGPPETWTLF